MSSITSFWDELNDYLIKNDSLIKSITERSKRLEEWQHSSSFKPLIASVQQQETIPQGSHESTDRIKELEMELDTSQLQNEKLYTLLEDYKMVLNLLFEKYESEKKVEHNKTSLLEGEIKELKAKIHELCFQLKSEQELNEQLNCYYYATRQKLNLSVETIQKLAEQI